MEPVKCPSCNHVNTGVIPASCFNCGWNLSTGPAPVLKTKKAAKPSEWRPGDIRPVECQQHILEIQRLKRQLEIALTGLRYIVNPLAFMAEDARKQGMELDTGMAMLMADNANYLKTHAADTTRRVCAVDAGTTRRTIPEWEAVKGIDILDPDGFDRRDDKLYERLFTESEFDARSMHSTIGPPGTIAKIDEEPREILDACDGIKVGDVRFYHECGDVTKVRVNAITRRNGGVAFSLEALYDSANAGPFTPIPAGDTWEAWRKDGPNAYCGWTLLEH